MRLKQIKKNERNLLERIQSFLYSFYAKDLTNARINEVYDCLCRALMEDIGRKWVDSKSDTKEFEVYILSFEYLPGRFIERNIARLGKEEEIRDVLEEIGFSYEDVIAFEKEANLGVGDIGIGSSYLISELANKKIRSVAYALRYENGNLKQRIVDGKQVEYSDYWLEEGSNWEHKKGFSYELDIDGKKHKSIAYDIAIVNDAADFVSSLRLFQSEPTQAINYSEFSRGDLFKAYDDYLSASSINQFLYLDDSSYDGKLLRLKQEYFYSASAIRDIFKRYINRYGSIEGIDERIKIFANDIHPTIALVEFIRILNIRFSIDIKEAIFITRRIFEHIAFSITSDSLESYPVDMIKRVNPEILETIVLIQSILQEEDPKVFLIKNGYAYFKNINLALSNNYIYLSKILKEEKSARRKLSFTNLGTDRLMYLEKNNTRLMDVFRRYEIFDKKSYDISKIASLRNCSNFIDDLEEAKYHNKLELIDLAKEKINPYSLFDVQLSIIHESKRQILNALAIAYKYYYFKENTNIRITPKTYVFSGKANEGYFMAKETIKFILALKHMIDKDKIIREKIKIVFIEDLDVYRSKIILKATDIYNNLTLANLDNQDFHMLNSALNMANILTTKGGICENIKENKSFYTVGDSYKEIVDDKKSGSYDANSFYYSNDMVRYTVENLIRESYDIFPYDFKVMYDQIMMYNDSFRIFKDLEDLLVNRENIEIDYLDKEKWVKNEIENILWANNFKLDNKIIRNGINDWNKNQDK